MPPGFLCTPKSVGKYSCRADCRKIFSPTQTQASTLSKRIAARLDSAHKSAVDSCRRRRGLKDISQDSRRRIGSIALSCATRQAQAAYGGCAIFPSGSGNLRISLNSRSSEKHLRSRRGVGDFLYSGDAVAQGRKYDPLDRRRKVEWIGGARPLCRRMGLPP